MSPAPEESSRSRLVVAHITGDQFVHNDIYYHTSTRLVGALSSRRREGGRVSHTPSTRQASRARGQPRELLNLVGRGLDVLAAPGGAV